MSENNMPNSTEEESRPNPNTTPADSGQAVQAPVGRELSKKHRFSHKLIALALLVVLVLAVVACLIIFKLNSSPSVSNNPNQPPFSYAYNELQNYKPPKYQSGRGVAFQIPVEFTTIGNLPYDNMFSSYTQADLAHQNAKKAAIASLSLVVDLSKQSPTADYLAAVSKTLSSPTSDSEYKAIAKAIVNFVATGTDNKYNFTVGRAQSFTSPNIKANAWQIYYKIEYGITPNDPTRPPFSGRVVYAIGKNAEYYFTVVSVSNNWDSNAATWQKVFDSLKIDQ